MVDMSSAAANAAQPKLSEAAFFSVHARAEPGVMPRVLELFAKRGLVPSGWRSSICAPDRSRLRIEIEMHGLDPGITEYIAACLRQIVSVETVLTTGCDHRH
jgi:acetolactate synthase small subunit